VSSSSGNPDHRRLEGYNVRNERSQSNFGLWCLLRKSVSVWDNQSGKARDTDTLGH